MQSGENKTGLFGVTLLDTTLRDGEQSPGVAFSIPEKVKIVNDLYKTGIRFIEAGTPAMQGVEFDAFCEIIQATANQEVSIIAWNRALESDIQHSIDAGAKHLHISCPVSDIQLENKIQQSRQWVKDRFLELIPDLIKDGYSISAGFEDASRADPLFLYELCDSMPAEITRLRICDTVGILTPEKTYDLVKNIYNRTQVPVEIHAHNDFGLAVANSLSALRAGASFVDTTLLGLGERAGNASMEETVLSLIRLYQIDLPVNPVLMTELSRYIASIVNWSIAPNRPVLGKNIFLHESGIHADGILKNPENYEPYPPSIIGKKHELVIGKHSGRKALCDRLEDLGITLEKDELNELLLLVRVAAVEKKDVLSDEFLRNAAKKLRTKITSL